MKAEGFIPNPSEWWHFDDPDWQKFPILDIDFDKIP
jgi:D-alanyl-D-alanine dipeptidase